MLLDALNKILYVVFFISLLNVIRHIYYMLQGLSISTNLEENQEPVKYKLSSKSLFLLGASIAYILMTIFTGIKL
jgi:hypothetical protein